MTKKGLCIIGDVHTQDNTAKYNQCRDFFDWFLTTEYASEEWDKLFLGDLYESPQPSNQCVWLVLNFIHSLRGHKYIVTGNHDRNPETNALDVFSALKSVTIIDKETVMDIEGLKCLILPHMDTEVRGLPPMITYYNDIIPKTYTDTYDYVFHHLEDNTEHFGESFVDLSTIKGKVVAGHIHTANIKEDGHYLGSVCKNSAAEKDDIKLLGCISYDTKDISYVEIPSFLEFGSLEYPNLPESYDKNTLYTITKAPTKADAQLFYETEFKNHNAKFYFNKIISVKEEIFYDESVTVDVQSEDVYLDMFGKECQVKQSILDKCKEIV